MSFNKFGPKVQDLTGSVFGRWTVVGYAERKDIPGSTWLCRCECGTERVVRRESLTRGKSSSCGCLNQEMRKARTGKENGRYSHGLAGTSTHRIWQGMRRRCESENAPKYRFYGARGIKVCERWKVFENFVEDMGVRPAGMTIDRIDTEGDYEPGNCRWITMAEQQRNKRSNRRITASGRTMLLADWAREIGISVGALHGRITRGMTEEEAVTTPRLRR